MVPAPIQGSDDRCRIVVDDVDSGETDLMNHQRAETDIGGGGQFAEPRHLLCVNDVSPPVHNPGRLGRDYDLQRIRMTRAIVQAVEPSVRPDQCAGLNNDSSAQMMPDLPLSELVQRGQVGVDAVAGHGVRPNPLWKAGRSTDGSTSDENRYIAGPDSVRSRADSDPMDTVTLTSPGIGELLSGRTRQFGRSHNVEDPMLDASQTRGQAPRREA